MTDMHLPQDHGSDASTPSTPGGEGVHSAPPPPPAAPAYAAPQAYAGQPVPPKRSFVRVIARLFLTAVAMGMVAVTCLVLGFYAGLFMNLDASGVTSTTYQAGAKEQRIAIIPVVGMIDEAQAAFFDQCVDKAIHDGRVRAVVLRVDSGGGLVGPSDEMWRNVKRLKDEGIYVVASYGSVAASGGYYMSVAADEIFAQPTSITGSIGVMGSVWTFQGLLEDKLGITPETITATGSPEKDVANNLFRNWTDRDRTEIRRIIDAMYARFAEVVVAGRSEVLSEEEARALCTGKVFMADEAKQVKLIDAVGYLDDAVAAAASGAKLSNPTVERYEMKAGMMEMFMARANPTGGVGVELDSRAVRKLVTELGMPRMMYLYQP